MSAARTLLAAVFFLGLAGGFSEGRAECVSGHDARQVLEQGQAAPLPTAMQNAGMNGAPRCSMRSFCRAGGGWSYRVRYRQNGQVNSANIPAS